MASPEVRDAVYQPVPDAFYVRKDDGVWLRNNAGSFTVRGDGSYVLVQSLFENLDGSTPVREICAELPAQTARFVERLVGTLAQRGFLRRVTHPPEEVPGWLAQRYGTHVRFLQEHGDYPVARFLRMRATPVACVGEGAALRALLAALAEFGFADVRVHTTSGSAAAVAAAIEAVRTGDAAANWTVLVDGPRLDLATAVATTADAAVLLLAVDDRPAADLAAAQRVAAGRGQPAGVLGRCGEFVVAVPPGAVRDWCWQCVQLSIARPTVGAGTDLTPAVAPATVGALHVVRHCFGLAAGIELDGADTVSSAEPLAPVVRTHRPYRHPACPAHASPAALVPAPAGDAGAAVRPDIATADDAAPVVAEADRIVAAAAGWTDQVLGPLLELGEDELDQLPLAASACRIATPESTAEHPDSERVICRALAPREARNQVVLLAMERLVRRGGRAYAGVGWSRAEARYRALLAAASAVPAPPDAEVRWYEPGEHTAVTEHLAAVLAATGRGWQRYGTQRLPGGFLRVLVRTADGAIAGGIGIDLAHATGNALLQAIHNGLASSGEPTGAQHAHPAHLAPPVSGWSEALAVLAELTAPGSRVADIAPLPFLVGHAHVAVANPTGDER